jgi:F420H(2)-dependent quinone reductase
MLLTGQVTGANGWSSTTGCFDNLNWVKNIESNARVHVRVGDCEFDATARALDESRDRETWLVAQSLAREKYGWGDGLPVEIVRDP